MEYQFGSRLSGKAFAQMIQLRQNIEKGLDCAVATLNPEKTKKDFEYMTGAKLNLEPREDGENIYSARINAL